MFSSVPTRRFGPSRNAGIPSLRFRDSVAVAGLAAAGLAVAELAAAAAAVPAAVVEKS